MPSYDGIRSFVTGAGGSIDIARSAVSGKTLVLPEQTHSVNVGIVTDPSQHFLATDALITQLADVALGIRTADCVPVLFYSPDINAIAAAHAGWKGSLGGIVDLVVDKLVELGASLSEIRVIFSVSICGKCYEVDDELAGRFADAGFTSCISRVVGEKPHLDLQRVNEVRLRMKGILPEHVTLNRQCTKCSVSDEGNSLYYSWRRQPGISDRNYSVICFE